MGFGFKVILLVGSLVLCLIGVSSRGIVSDSYSIDNYQLVVSGSTLEGDYSAYSVLGPLDVKSGGIVFFESLEDAPSSVSGGGAGGVVGGGVAVVNDIVSQMICLSNQDCMNNSQCIQGVCSTSFNVEIVNLSDDVDSGDFLDFNYLITSQSDLNGTVVTDFWMESSLGEKVSSGKIVMYLVDGQSVILTNRVFVPDYIDSGDYYLKTNSYYKNEDIESTDIESVKVFGKIDPVINNMLKLIVVSVILLTLVILLAIRHKKLISIWKYFVSYYLSKVKYNRRDNGKK